MEMDGISRKGTVTPLASMYDAEEAQKAARRVQDIVSEKEKELDILRGFISDNSNLINLVQKLPEELSHDIMVPFGKAAFFPGRLIHTNEFMVLLGEGYYAERTAKQTVDILQRRGKVLDSQVDSLQAMIKDLNAEASFFASTASEAAEGLVEIREDYLEENLSEVKSNSDQRKADTASVLKSDGRKLAKEDEEYMNIMAKLDELEKEELAAENATDIDERKLAEEDEEYVNIMAKLDELENEELAAENATDSDDENKDEVDDSSGQSSSQESPASGIKYSQKPQQRKQQTQLKNDQTTQSLAMKPDMEERLTDNLNTCLDVENIFRGPSDGKSSVLKVKDYNDGAKVAKLVEKEVDQKVVTSSQLPAQSPPSTFDPSKAFTGSIVEHSQNLPSTTGGRTSAMQKPSNSQPSKPVSRFKMQRR